MNFQAMPPEVLAQERGLIGIDEARERAASYAGSGLATEVAPLVCAAGRVLAADLRARHAQPPFDNSAMDGYAAFTNGEPLEAGSRLQVTSRTPAGSVATPISPGTCARIFTGASLPAGADAVVMQEHVLRDGDHIVLRRALMPGDNIRRQGEDIQPGELLLSAGQRLDARHVALIASQGHALVRIQQRIRVGVISTGRELVQPGRELEAAQIYDSNRPMLATLAAHAGAEVVDGGWVDDEADALAARMQDLAATCQLVVTTGGASVSEEDHSFAALKRAGGHGEVLRIALKPGKPAVVGRMGEAAYLGLPGNPVAALVSWLMLGSAVLGRLRGFDFERPRGEPLTCAVAHQRRPGRTEFAPARVVTRPDGGKGLEILGRGGSARLMPLVLADGLAEIPAAVAHVPAGMELAFHRFGGCA
ncbi:molybdopterin molybdenumtransferase MoeA [Alsobacter soli]|uniref:Molybdopterin molybdenumtransferase n=1 Tax=Alsobacter soli TaxID=2109933 RepID=A0A2T1HVH1_9HYPH|nr:gephyrin-like molybdotransferase Glp [Alsobacter soli]PSC05647.1 molybdopterin molybdenumtransferase MoeA [Alsobacter soli]